MKENLDPLIEEKWSKQDEFATFISTIEKLPNPNVCSCLLGGLFRAIIAHILVDTGGTW